MANTDIITTAREIHTTEQQIADARTARNRTDIARLNRQHRKLTATLQQMTIAALNNGADAGTLRAQVWAALDGKATTPADLEQVIVDTIHQLAAEPDAWVSLTRLRAALPTTHNRDAVDTALRNLDRKRAVDIAPEDNMRMMTEADHAAALRHGGQDRHLIATC
ncbi:hypothetical protein [Micromonospora sp. NBC_00421]|uniref:hypothetical protein n=1 Tax=Micromonospora sp. NBC_00421 TaxID=2975976 RepID=UPI002E1D9FE9